MIRPVQETKHWKDRGLVGKLFTTVAQPLFRWTQGTIVPPLEFISQAPDAARNLELILEHLAPMAIESPGHLARIAWAIHDWRTRYTSAQDLTSERDYYVLTTQEDMQIPFRPEADTHYAHILPNIASTARALAKTKRYAAQSHFKYLIGTVSELNKEAEATYHAYPTKVPRNTKHNRLTLSVVQKYDPPLNCCPSLHIAYSWFMYNIAKHAGLNKRDPAAWESIEQSTLGMVKTVLALKQHCMRDVAFGITAARIVFERRFKHDTYDDLTDHFVDLTRADTVTPYTRIREIHDEIVAMRDGDSLKNLLGRYIKRHGFPKVNAGTEAGYWDDEKRVLRAA